MRRVADFAEVTAFEGALRVPQYTSAEMYSYAYKAALPRGSGRVQRNAIIIPMRKSKEWWDKAALDRQMYFYPHSDATGMRQGTRTGGGARHPHDLSQAVLQPRRAWPGRPVGFRDVLRVR